MIDLINQFLLFKIVQCCKTTFFQILVFFYQMQISLHHIGNQGLQIIFRFPTQFFKCLCRVAN
jgi:hypothetical protein